MITKTHFIIGALLSVFAVGCAKSNEKKNHAVGCGGGQVLTYNTNSDYTCKFQSNSNSGTAYYPPTYQAGNIEVVFAPVASCPEGQLLVQWNSNWICYHRDVIYPENGDSPRGQMPPVGRGGEWCNSTQTLGGVYGYPTPSQTGGNTSYDNGGVKCSPGHYCNLTGSSGSGLYGTGLNGTCTRAY